MHFAAKSGEVECKVPGTALALTFNITRSSEPRLIQNLPKLLKKIQIGEKN